MTISDDLDTAANLTNLLGDAAKLALNVGSIAIPIIEFVVPWIPVLGPFASDLEIALPIIQKIATYAPEVSTIMKQNKSMIEAVTEIGEAVLNPLSALFAHAQGIDASEVDLASVTAFISGTFKASLFSPTDPRFAKTAEYE